MGSPLIIIKKQWKQSQHGMKDYNLVVDISCHFFKTPVKTSVFHVYFIDLSGW